jgi:hypothetical protein
VDRILPVLEDQQGVTHAAQPGGTRPTIVLRTFSSVIDSSSDAPQGG